MDQERGLDHFHDSELGDVYDLYNACNGALRDGLLDVRKLDELTPGERAVLDVARLREVWAHTSTGCGTCQIIIQTLNAARGTMRSHADGSPRSEPRPAPPDAPGRAEEKALGQSR
ncbi:MAG: hypothetical protein M3379_21515 [Acidobacteriota bacterium]|nr:hypothetical protein [Acidobacteriota bacterium]